MNAEEALAEVRYKIFQSLNPEYKDLDWADLLEEQRQIFMDDEFIDKER